LTLSKTLSEKLTAYFSEDAIEELARESHFVIRESKMTGFMFMDLLLFSTQNLKEQSLEDLAFLLKERYGIEITKQGLDERFTEKAVDFLKKLLGKAIAEIYNPLSELICLKKLGSVRIKDSTSFQLPKNMEEYYPGSGGSGSKACIRIQFEYDLIKGEIVDLSLHAYNDPDISNASETVDNINCNDLIIRDLGYIRTDVLSKIDKKQAYFLNRLQCNMNVYEIKKGKYKKVNFVAINRYLRLLKLQDMEKEVYIGEEHSIKLRMVIERVPEKVINERLRKAERQAKKKGRKLSNEYKIRAGLNIFITNIDKQDLSVNDVRQIYGLRWQIEIVFKTWKSIAKIHELKKMKVLRFECCLYAKLIWVVLNLNMVWETIKFFYHDKILLSYFKLFKAICNRKESFRQAILSGKDKTIEYLMKIFPSFPNYFKSDKKKDKLSFYDRLELL